MTLEKIDYWPESEAYQFLCDEYITDLAYKIARAQKRELALQSLENSLFSSHHNSDELISRFRVKIAAGLSDEHKKMLAPYCGQKP